MSKFISIQELENTESKQVKVQFNEFIDGLDLAQPLRADLTVKSLGDFVEVSGNVKGIVKLVCDFCLKEFEYNFDFEIDEMFAKSSLLDSYGQELELKGDQFVTDLCGEDEIDICDLLYQSVILNIPNQKVCGINCNRGTFPSEEEVADPRLEVFKNIEINPKK